MVASSGKFRFAEQNVGSDSLSRILRLITPTQIFASDQLHHPIRLNFKRQIKENTKHVPCEVRKRWRQEGSKLIFSAADLEIFDMPEDWSMEETHEDLFRTAHYVLTSPWEDGILDDWIPSREPGWRPGLAFSGGVDSVASMLLMPQDTVLVYNRRDGFKSGLNHTNADRLFGTCLRRWGVLSCKFLQITRSYERRTESLLASKLIMHVPFKYSPGRLSASRFDCNRYATREHLPLPRSPLSKLWDIMVLETSL